MKFICEHANECDDTTCPHLQSHDDCGHTCERVDGAKCVMDVDSLPIVPKTGTVAIMIKQREVA